MNLGKFIIMALAVVAIVADAAELVSVIHEHSMAISLQVNYIAQTMVFIVVMMFMFNALMKRKR